MASPPNPRQPPRPERREASDEILAAMLTGKSPSKARGVPAPPLVAMPVLPAIPVVSVVPVARPVAVVAPLARRPAVAYRPSLRDPLPILIACDDGDQEGEMFRLRGDRFVIGRSEGDLVLPFDSLISGRHVEITRQKVGGTSQWVVTDLQSSNGLFVRVSRSPLGNSAEFLVGRGRYLFEMPPGPPEAVDQIPGARTDQTHGWLGEAPIPQPSLTEMLGLDIGNRVILSQPEYWIGSDPACVIRRLDDPFVEPKHARLSRDASAAWQIEHRKSLNGIWLRKSQIIVDSTCQFQIGEQRFRIRIGG